MRCISFHFHFEYKNNVKTYRYKIYIFKFSLCSSGVLPVVQGVEARWAALFIGADELMRRPERQHVPPLMRLSSGVIWEKARRCGGVVVVSGRLSAPLLCALSCRCLLLQRRVRLLLARHSASPQNIQHTAGHRTSPLLYDRVLSGRKKSKVIVRHVGPWSEQMKRCAHARGSESLMHF